MANRNFANGGKQYSMRVMPVLADCSFKVDISDANGIAELRGPLIDSVLMKSSHGTPTMTIADGTIIVRLSDGYNKVLSVRAACIRSPLSGSDVKIDNSAMTAGVAYTITTLGDATDAKWEAIGVPPGVTPAVGVSFVALTNGGSGNTLTSRVQATATAGSTVDSIEVVGDPSKSVSPDPSENQGYGAQIILQCRDDEGAIVQPADDSVITLEILLDNSSIDLD